MDSSPAPEAPIAEAGTAAPVAVEFPALAWTGKAIIAGRDGRMIPGRTLTPEEVAYWFQNAMMVEQAIKHGYYTILDPATAEPPATDPPTTDPLTEDASDEEDHENA